MKVGVKNQLDMEKIVHLQLVLALKLVVLITNVFVRLVIKKILIKVVVKKTLLLLLLKNLILLSLKIL